MKTLNRSLRTRPSRSAVRKRNRTASGKSRLLRQPAFDGQPAEQAASHVRLRIDESPNGPANSKHESAGRPELLAHRGNTQRSLLRRAIDISAAVVFICLGVAGAILPGLPATPFLLLASWFLSRSWPAMNARLHKSRFFGGILRDWQEHRGIRRVIKIRAIGAVVVSVLITIAVSPLSFVPLMGIAACASTGIVIIWRLSEA